LTFGRQFGILGLGDFMIFDTLENIKNYEGLCRVYTALEFLSKTDFKTMDLGRYELDGDNIFYMVQEYSTDPEKTISEAHKKYIDIQFMVEGEELIGVAPINCEKCETQAIPENDVWFYECKTESITLIKNSFMVLYPNDLHCPGVATNGRAMGCRKVVVKVKV
jgi:YhcH/YjgK/YiaL family protein